MAFENYLSYEEYVILGGKVPEDVFPVWEKRARKKIDCITFNRIHLLETVPEDVKDLAALYINLLYSHSMSTGDTLSVVSYSNGVESFSYAEDSTAKLNKELYRMATEYLPEYLLTRSVAFDVEQYIQSANNNPK